MKSLKTLNFSLGRYTVSNLLATIIAFGIIYSTKIKPNIALNLIENSTKLHPNNVQTNQQSMTTSTTPTALIGATQMSINAINNTSTPATDDETPDYTPMSERPETYIVTVLFMIIFVVGVLGNGTLVIIFFKHRSMRNIPNTYILSLALADLLVIIVCVPLATIVYTQDSWTLGLELCRITETFKDISIGVSVFTLTALSGERYYAIVNPLRKLQTKPLTVFTAVIIWLFAILLATPSFLISDLQEHPLYDKRNSTIISCSPFGANRTNLVAYSRYTVVCKAFIYYLLPLSIIGALYILMAKRLHISAREMPGEAVSTQCRTQARARRHVARMVVAFVVVFFVCFFPYHLFELWFHLYPTAEEDFDYFWHIVRITGFCTSFLHSCVNPVALYCVSGVFRQHFNRYLCCWCVKKQSCTRQHSTATGMLDTHTSIQSVRRSTIGYNRASMHMNNNLSGGGDGSIAGYEGGRCHRTSFGKHHNNMGTNCTPSTSNNSDTNSMSQSVIVKEKR